jgi:hypothetical protein
LLLHIRGCRKLAGDWSIWRRNLKIPDPDAACLAIKEEEEEKKKICICVYACSRRSSKDLLQEFIHITRVADWTCLVADEV